MKIPFWNARGLGNPGRCKQLKELIHGNEIDVVAIQETIRADFSVKELNQFGIRGDFVWNFIPSRGQSGGLLLGAN